VQKSIFDNTGDQLTSKTTIELINGSSNQTLTGTVKIYRDGALYLTIGPATMSPNSIISLSNASATIMASADDHSIRADVTIKDSGGNTVSTGSDTHIYQKRFLPQEDYDQIVFP
jgi:glucose/arabinose dehydrogenase